MFEIVYSFRHTKQIRVRVVGPSLQHVVVHHPVDGLPFVVVQVGYDAPLGGYLVESIQSRTREVRAAGVLLLDYDTAPRRGHRHFGADLEPADKGLPVALAIQALLHAGHHRFVRKPSAIVVTPYRGYIKNSD